MRREVIDTARTYIGTPFHHQGRIKDVGVDCIGLLVGVASELHIPHGDLASYPRSPRDSTLCDELDRYVTRIDRNQIQPGDIVVFMMRRHRSASHAGIVTDRSGGRLGLIHTWYSTQKVVEHILDEQWRRRMQCGYVWPGVEPTWRP